jgi:hypothetical protein
MDPFPCLVFVLDVRSFGSMRNPEMLATRDLLYRLVIAAFETGGVRWADCEHEDRGDGIIIVVPATVPKTVVMGPVLTELMRLVADAPSNTDGRDMQVRIAAHGGEVHRDDNGFAGSDVILPFRLLDSQVLRDTLAEASARCVVMVSDSLYQGTVRHNYPGMAGRVFQPVQVQGKETNLRAWLHVPGGVVTTPPEPRPEPPAPQHNGVHISAGGDIKVDNGVLAGGDVTTTEHYHGTWWRRGKDEQ